MTMPSLCVPITITATNKWISFKYPHDSAEYNAAVAVGEYADIYALLNALGDAMQVVCAAYETSWLEVKTDGAIGGLTEFYTDNSLEILWHTGTHGAEGAHDHIGDVLGYSDAADDEILVPGYLVSDFQHQGGWYHNASPMDDSLPQLEHVGSDLQTTLDQTDACVIDICTRHQWDLEFFAIPKEAMFAQFATGANLNRDLETVWRAMVGGSKAIYRPDYTVPATHHHLWLEKPRALLGAAKRAGKTQAYWRIDLHFREVEV